MKKRTALWIQVAIGYCFPLALLLASIFSNRWVIKDGISKGLFYQHADSGYSLNLIDKNTIVSEGMALVMEVLACFHSILSVVLYGPDQHDDIDNGPSRCYAWNCMIFYSCSIIMYPFTGLFMLFGCIRLGTLYPTEVLGESFYLCSVAGCLHFVVIFISCCDAMCKSKQEEFVFGTFTRKLYNRPTIFRFL